MNANDAIRLHICNPSVLTFTASGTSAVGANARLVVSLNDRQLASMQVNRPHHYSISLPDPGWVIIALVNALQGPSGARTLRISDLALRAQP